MRGNIVTGTGFFADDRAEAGKLHGWVLAVACHHVVGPGIMVLLVSVHGADN